MNLYLAIQAFMEVADCYDGIGITPSMMDEMRSTALKLAPHKPVRIVSDWLWVDSSTDEKLKESLDSMGLTPAFICSLNVIHDDQHAIPSGGYVRTTLLRQFSNNCIFETRNTSYVLIGSGKRFKATQNEAQYIFSLR